jgi:Toprim domain-containing protein
VNVRAYDVEDVVHRLGIPHERRGRRIWMRCPKASDPRRHAGGDKDWSATIWPNEAGDRQGLFHCHSCHFSGNLARLVAVVLGMEDDFISTAAEKAHRWLAGSATQQKPIVSIRLVVPPLGRPAFFLPEGVVVGAPLECWPVRERDYLVARGITPQQVARWGIGHALSGRLSNRIVLVTRDATGRVANYAARAVVPSNRRYLMADTDEHPDRTVLFGEEHWRGDTIVLTEGAFDALAVERVTDVAVGALSGSNVSPEVVAKLARFDRILVATDADSAGARAARRLAFAMRDKDLRRVVFPRGEDANSLPPDHLLALLRAAEYA